MIHAVTKLGVTPVNCSRQLQCCEDRKSGSHKLITQSVSVMQAGVTYMVVVGTYVWNMHLELCITCHAFWENYVVTRKQGSILKTTQCAEILVMCGSHVTCS